ncbi:TetR/AcrR family transcriptional regulator [Lactovum miscens]|uniref:AcrR family transcriptional regulator n=1 Tax=Lactovum miscens TaxID=190387 RepID=A0A841C2Y9_9LACT|nr:TetR/AcrR family transcriptional regulator [Lactovum miscens]MBB5888326.1 AcrR family transcriptional regulator [Lactovum miscens]
MGKLTQELILDTTEKLIYEFGMDKTTLNDIAKRLNVSHPALYKHFLNKEELFQKLAWRWLEETSKNLFNWTKSTISTRQNLHDWLWLLASTKKTLFEKDQRMFSLYTDYIENNEELITIHLRHLAEKVSEITGLDEGKGKAIITAFIYFHNPYFANQWDRPNYKVLFEDTFCLLDITIS